jgi:hypothetical protein
MREKSQLAPFSLWMKLQRHSNVAEKRNVYARKIMFLAHPMNCKKASKRKVQQTNMEGQHKHDIGRLGEQLRALSDQLSDLGDNSDFDELLLIIHSPSWTTVAEFTLVSSIVESMMVQAEALSGLKEALITGSRLVGAESE